MNRFIAAALVSFCAFSLVVAQDKEAAAQPSDPPVAGAEVLGVAAAESIAIATGYRASKLIGKTVYNDQGEQVGKIGDLIVRADGKLSFAIVDVGGFLGVDRHHVAIPVGRFTSVEPKMVLPGATKDTLKTLPEFQYAQR